MHLRHAISQFNALLYYRMASRGSVSSMETPLQDFRTYPDLSAHNIAALMPGAASYSLHLPLHRCDDKVQRILRFVESECEVLPSKERCPYVVVVEVLQQSFDCKSEQLYTQGINPAEYLPNGVENAQILYTGHAKLPTPAQLPEVTEITTTNAVQSLVQSVDEREHLDCSARTQSAAWMGPLGHSAIGSTGGSTSRGSLLSDSFLSSKAQNRYRYRRGYRSFRLPSTSNTCAGNTDSTSEAEQLQEAYDLYDQASESAAATTATENADETCPPAQLVQPSNRHQNAHLFTHPGLVEQAGEIKLDAHDVDMKAMEGTSTKHINGGADDFASVNALRGGHDENNKRPQEHSGDRAHPVHPTRSPSRRGSRSYARRRGQSATALPRLPADQANQAEATRPPQSSHGPPLPPFNEDEQQDDERVFIAKAFPTRPLGEVRHYSTPHREQSYLDEAVDLRGEPAVTDHEHSQVVDAHPQRHPQLHPHYSPHYLHPATGLPHPHAQLQQPRAYVRPKTWQERKAIIRASSPFGNLAGWDMKSFIVKSGDDLRKEVIVGRLDSMLHALCYFSYLSCLLGVGVLMLMFWVLF